MLVRSKEILQFGGHTQKQNIHYRSFSPEHIYT